MGVLTNFAKSTRKQLYQSLFLTKLQGCIFQHSDWLRSECGKMQTRIIPNTDTFHAVDGARVKEKITLILPINTIKIAFVTLHSLHFCTPHSSKIDWYPSETYLEPNQTSMMKLFCENSKLRFFCKKALS